MTSLLGLLARRYAAWTTTWLLIVATLVVVTLPAYASTYPDDAARRIAVELAQNNAAVMSVLFHLHSPAWDAWFSDAVPDAQKNKFFGRWGLWSGIGLAAASEEKSCQYARRPLRSECKWAVPLSSSGFTGPQKTRLTIQSM